MTSGYVKFRRGLQEHVINGRMTIMEYGVFCWLLQSADDSSGFWWGSAKALACQVRLTPRNARYLLESLEKKGYLKRFNELRQKGNYAVGIWRFVCSRGASKDKSLNILLTSDWRHAVYELVPTDCPPAADRAASKHCPATAPYQEEEVKPNTQEKEKEATPAAAPPFVLPDWVPEIDWKDWLLMRKAKRNSPTPRAKELAVEDLEELRDKGFDPSEVLKNCIKKGWSGIYPPKKEIADHGEESLAERRSREGREASARALLNFQRAGHG